MCIENEISERKKRKKIKCTASEDKYMQARAHKPMPD